MTYENVVSWCEKNLPQENYDTFADWYNASYDAVNTPNLFSNKDFNRMMEDSWLGNYGTFDRTIDKSDYVEPYDTPESRGQRIDMPSKPTLPEQERQIPSTGRAPELPKPVLVFPSDTPTTQKKSFIQRLRGLFKR